MREYVRPNAAFYSRRSSDKFSSMKIARESSKTPNNGYLDGQVLVAMPTMQDERFSRSVILAGSASSSPA